MHSLRGGRRLLSLAFLQLAALHLAAAAASQQPCPWIYLDSGETASGPFLLLELADRSERSIPVAIDTVLIEYLAGDAYPDLPQLAIDRDDRNRSLLRFDVPQGLAIARATLRAHAHPSNLPPAGMTSFRVHAATAAWDRATTWTTAPAFDPDPLALALVPRAGGEVRLDLTAVVRAWAAQPAANFGIVLRQLRDEGEAKAAPAPPASTTPDEALSARVRTCIAWRPAAAAALAEATVAGKLVLALVLCDDAPPLASTHERAFVASTLLDPDVQALLQRRFVPVRVATTSPMHFASKTMAGDPLRALGLDARQVKAPALVVCGRAGAAPRILQSIGTWDRDLVVRFLLAAVPEEQVVEPNADATAFQHAQLRYAALCGDHAGVLAHAGQLLAAQAAFPDDLKLARAVSLLRLGRVREAAGTLRDALADVPPALAPARDYWQAMAAHRLGDRIAARSRLQAVADQAPHDSPFQLRAEMRLRWSNLLDELEPAKACEWRGELLTTERARAPAELDAVVAGALDYVLSRQQDDGRFAHPAWAMYDAAMTALVGSALHAWADTAGEAQRGRVGTALQRAEAWCAGYAGKANAAQADSFGAAYLVDFAVARARQSESMRKLVPAAIELLVAGQLDNGAWSYNREFGMRWQGGFGGWPKTDKGRAHSINTGLSLWALQRARAAGFDVPQDALDAGARSLGAMQESKTTFSYTWPDPRSFHQPGQSLGKACVCLQALVALGHAAPADLDAAVAEFMAGRGGLRATVKLTPSWIGPGGTSSYFFFQSYYHAAEAIVAAGGAAQGDRLRELRDDLLAVVEVDGTWLDYEDSGKTYGTAMALLVLARAR